MAARILYAAVLGVAATAAQAAPGVFNMPTTLPQCFGYGCGPGHHAHMALKPCYRGWSMGKQIRRMQPDDYPTLYQRQAMYGGMVTPAAPRYDYAPAAGYAAPAAVHHAPTPAAPVSHTPRVPAAETVPAEPTSPGDAEPDELPMPAAARR